MVSECFVLFSRLIGKLEAAFNRLVRLESIFIQNITVTNRYLRAMSHEFEPPVAAVVATLNQKLHKAISD